MNRRGFLGSLLGLAASPVAGALPTLENPVSGMELMHAATGWTRIIADRNPLFTGHLGQWEGVTFWGEQWSHGELVKMYTLDFQPLSINRIRS